MRILQVSFAYNTDLLKFYTHTHTYNYIHPCAISNPQFEVFENFTSKGRICSDFCEKISKLKKPLIPVFSSSERACSFYERKNHGFSRQFFDYLYWPCLPRQGYCV
jgi:hypothetical protein